MSINNVFFLSIQASSKDVDSNRAGERAVERMSIKERESPEENQFVEDNGVGWRAENDVQLQVLTEKPRVRSFS